MPRDHRQLGADAGSTADGGSSFAAAYVVLLIATLGGAYMVSQALRNSIGVIAPDLARELTLSAGEIGILSSAFFIAFAAVQVPLGVCLDRFGPKACMLACAGLAVGGTAMFAAAASPLGLVAARVLMGVGCSCYLMAPLAFYARRFPPQRFATLTGLQLGIGTLGTIFSTAPLALSAASLGWRATFALLAGAMAVSGLLILLAVPAEPATAAARPRETVRETFGGILAASRTPSVGALFLMQLTGYSSFVLVVGLWGGPYLTDVYGYGLTERGDLLLLGAIGQAAGAVLYAPLVRLFGGHKPPVLLGGGLSAAALLLLAVAGTLPPVALALWLAAFGAMSGYTGILVAHGKTLFPPAIVGRGMTLLNIGTMGGVFVSQSLTGAIIDLFPKTGGAYPADAYRVVFAVQALCIVATWLAYRRAADPYGQTQMPVESSR